jgi:ABC-type transport system involved in cytochrome bd biosynthesis fused ATPase/permease subunit
VTSWVNADFNAVARFARTLFGNVRRIRLLPPVTDQSRPMTTLPTTSVRLAIVADAQRDCGECTRTMNKRLNPWCSDGKTLALVGSSGVGKTTIQELPDGCQ